MGLFERLRQAIDVPRLTEELEPRKKEAKQRSSGWGLDLGLGGITQAPAALRDIVSPTAPAPAPGPPATADGDGDLDPRRSTA